VLAARTSILAARAHHVPSDIWFASQADVACASAHSSWRWDGFRRPGRCCASPSCGCSRRGLVCLPIGLKPSAASPGGATQLLAASLPLRSYIQFASKADVNC
jgi:hypothetical protein